MERARFDCPNGHVAGTPAGQAPELDGIVSRAITETALARRTEETRRDRTCPHCRSNDVVLNGKDQNGRQRFKCLGCGRSYNILTGTAMARARKPEKWGQYLGCMTGHMSVRDIVASGLGVHHVTAWRWRHRFLRPAANDNAALLSGLIEADTMLFRQSFKGSRSGNDGNPRTGRAARSSRRGVAETGALPEQVPVLTALDRSGVFQAILASFKGIEAALDGRIAAGSVLCSDGSATYVNVAQKAGAEHFAAFVPAPTTKADKYDPSSTQAMITGRLGLRRVDSHHRGLKYLINEQCRGVATKFLAHYLGWNRAMVRPGFQGRMLLEWALR